jgi:hypothetical protein
MDQASSKVESHPKDLLSFRIYTAHLLPLSPGFFLRCWLRHLLFQLGSNLAASKLPKTHRGLLLFVLRFKAPLFLLKYCSHCYPREFCHFPLLTPRCFRRVLIRSSFPKTMFENNHQLGEAPAGCVYTHIHCRSRSCRDKRLVKFIKQSPKNHYGQGKKGPLPVPR